VAEQVLSRDLPPGTRVRYKPGGDIFVLARRKKPSESNLPGWWIEPVYGGGGLADVVIDEARDWEVVLDG
jgi:hypothetical protein